MKEINYEVKNANCCDVSTEEQGEVRISIRILDNLISEFVVAFNELQFDLEPVLPQDDTLKYAEAPTPPQVSAYSCSLARQIEDECRRVERLNDRVHALLANIKL